MKYEVEIAIKPEEINNFELHKNLVCDYLKIRKEELSGIVLLKRSIDSRKKPIYRLKYGVFINQNPEELYQETKFKFCDNKKKVIIIGSGPAGLFAALRLLEFGIKPIILERGKDVRDRRRDLRNIQQFNIVNENSNYCFGEGGAGTYSDGKLYTRSNKRGDVKKIINLLVQHGANRDILIDSHPHLGSNKLPKIIENIRNTILNYGGEIYFEHKVTDFIIKNGKIFGVIVNDNKEINSEHVVLSTGHSANDIYELCFKHNILMAEKDYAVGVRIEHPQELIDSIQYKCNVRSIYLPAASYSLVTQVDKTGVFSFCMCPGGIIIPASTNQDELVLNGMSVSRRDSPFANSGFVTSVGKIDFIKEGFNGLKSGINYRTKIEKKANILSGHTQKAPAQRVIDFINKKISLDLPKTSYIPGLVSVSLDEVLPKLVAYRLRQGLLNLKTKMPRFITNEAIMLAPETRTSSPIRIVRDENFVNPNIDGLYPLGEGAGYAGGIVSAAIDGCNCADRIKAIFDKI
jgi:hypothetical protein